MEPVGWVPRKDLCDRYHVRPFGRQLQYIFQPLVLQKRLNILVLFLFELIKPNKEIPVLCFFSDNEYIGIKEIGDPVYNNGNALFQFLKRVYWKVKKTAFAFYALVSKQSEYKDKK